jgi:hypothetical protein
MPPRLCLARLTLVVISITKVIPALSLMLSQFGLQLLGPSPHHPSATSLSVSLLLFKASILRLLITFTAMHLSCCSSKLPPGLVGEIFIPETPNKRSSLSSVSPFPSSSTSSLLPPSLSITVSSLSAIPEGPPSALRPSMRYDNSDQEERRALRPSNRASTSSMTSSSITASSRGSFGRTCVRLNVIGRIELLPQSVQIAIRKAENLTRHNSQ